MSDSSRRFQQPRNPGAGRSESKTLSGPKLFTADLDCKGDERGSISCSGEVPVEGIGRTK
jgi:hypothetical protein